MSSASVTIRPVAMEDAGQIASLHAISFGGDEAYVREPWNEEDFREFITYANAQGHNPFLVAAIDATIVGFIMASFDPGKPYRAEIQTIDVDPSHRKEQIARALMNKLEEAIVEGREFDMATTVTANIHVKNIPSRRLFESFGYAVSNETSRRYQVEGDALLAAKEMPAKKPAAPKHK